MEVLLSFRFALFGLACAGLVYLQFYFAHRQWRRLKGEQATEIDLGYVRIEDCIPKSFRVKVKDWLQLPSPMEDVETERTIPIGREQVRVTGPLSMNAGQESNDILMVRGDFSCGPGCRIVREVWASGDAIIGEGSQLQALASDGALELGDRVSVARWVDSEEELRVGARCRIGSRATSRRAIRLGEDSQVASAYAPLVYTEGWDGSMNGTRATEAVPGLLELGPPEGDLPHEGTLRRAGIEASKLVRLSPQCWSYRGDFVPLTPIRLSAGLVVNGTCSFPVRSVLTGDIKAHANLFVGDLSICDGNLIALKDLCLGRGCRFAGVIHAGGSALLSSGTRGVPKTDPVAVYASEALLVEREVAIRGKLASGRRVVAVDSARAEEWTHGRRSMGA